MMFSENISFNTTKDMKERIEKLSVCEGKKVSSVIRELLSIGIKEKYMEEEKHV